MLISPARRIAFDVLRRVAEGAYASELLYRRLNPRLSRADAALATQITLGVLRWQRLLDFLIAQNLDRPIASLDLEVLLAMRIGLYQLRYLERIPAHAAVGEAVELAKHARKRSASSLINAVLRRAAINAKASPADLEKVLAPSASAAERAGVLYSHPTWLVERWFAAYGTSRTMALLDGNNRPPRVSCVVLPPQELDAVAHQLRAAGLTVRPGHWLNTALSISDGKPTETLPFREGRISLQDEASQMIGHLLGAASGETVLDLCAAPGGKTTLIARAIGPSGAIVAGDLHAHRLRSMGEQLVRTNTQNVALIELDATRPLPLARRFDRILLDAPCSGTGTLSGNPEIRWRLAPSDLVRTQEQQVAMLRNALEVLAPGGRLVYSTCSLEHEENEDVIGAALADAPGVRVVSGEDSIAPHLRHGTDITRLFDSNDFFRTFPSESHTDGFFAAVLKGPD